MSAKLTYPAHNGHESTPLQRGDMKVRKTLTGGSNGKLRRYQELILGRTDWGYLLKHELILLVCSNIPGALGLLLRSKLYPLLLGKVGRNVLFGSNITFRHPHKIQIGDNVIIDNNCMLDAKGVHNSGITIGNNVFLGRNTIVSCKDGDVILEDGVNVGFNCEIYSASTVRLRKNALVSAYCYFVGGGGYDLARHDISFAEQEGLDSTGIEVGENTWIGARTTALDGITIGREAVVAAGSLLREDVPPATIVAGVPARIVRHREPATI
ncbi:MAG: hypothetical protein KDE58_11855 [Caldilineaceae bacterium]|nr:hypothetical protein [Caldilineaceae bacterium]